MTDQQQQQQTDTTMDDFRASLPESVQTMSILKEADSPEVFWNRIKEQQSFLGESIRIPSNEAGNDDWTEFNNKLINRVPTLMNTPDLDNPEQVKAALQKLGLPEDSDGYTDVEGDEFHFVDGQMATLKSLANKAGLTRQQFKKLAEEIGRDGYNQLSAFEESRTEANAAMQAEWGLAVEDKYNQALVYAKSAGAPEFLIEQMENRSASAETVMWLHEMATKVGEVSQVAYQKDGVTAAITPYEAQQRINEIHRDPDHPYHHGDSTARARMHELLRAANPDRYAS